MGRPICLWLAMAFVLASPALAGIDKDAALYIGGTLGAVPDQTVGKLDFTHEERMTFRWPRGSWELPYARITSLEYGQQTGRRVGAAVVTVWALFSKKRSHFLTIGFTDAEGKNHAALIEIGKGRVKTSLAILEARTGLTVEYESQEAKEHVHG